MVFECGGPSYSELKAMDMAEYTECVAARELYLEKLEEVASSFDGVESCYAIQAGREIRVMVKPEKVMVLPTVERATVTVQPDSGVKV